MSTQSANLRFYFDPRAYLRRHAIRHRKLYLITMRSVRVTGGAPHRHQEAKPKTRMRVSVGITYCCKNWIARITSIGEKSIPPKTTGRCSRTKSKTGSVKARSVRTIGL